MNFSVLMSVYKNDNPDFFRTAVESVLVNQTVKPNELVLVVDGPVPESLKQMILNVQQECNEVKIIWLDKNGGLGNALKIGLSECSNEVVARMDSDDIASATRFQQQLEYIDNNPAIDIVGGQITEFIDSPDNIVGRREVPYDCASLKEYTKRRCPFNHMTVMFRKSAVLKSGGYEDWHYNEDYFLWIRMLLTECKFANLPQVLVNVRVGKDMYARRGGWKYFKSEAGIQRYMFDKGVISFPRYGYNVLGRFVLQVVMPNSLRAFLFQKLFRK